MHRSRTWAVRMKEPQSNGDAGVGMARSMIGLSHALSLSSAATLLTNFTNYAVRNAFQLS